MAKKPLKEPDAPRGPQYDFFLLVQQLVLTHGDESVAGIASRMFCSRQVLYRALTGPKLPSRRLVEELVQALGCSAHDRSEALAAWEAAVTDQRRFRRSGESGQPPQRQTQAPLRRSGRPLGPLEDTTPGTTMFASNLRALASNNGATVRQLAEEMSLAPSTMSRYFSGRRIPPRDVMERMLESIVTLGPMTPSVEAAVQGIRKGWTQAVQESPSIQRARQMTRDYEP
jgi:hypothetical protein